MVGDFCPQHQIITLEMRIIMDLKRQASAPLYEAIENFRKKRIVPFDVPGHKRGRGRLIFKPFFIIAYYIQTKQL